LCPLVYVLPWLENHYISDKGKEEVLAGIKGTLLSQDEGWSRFFIEKF